MTNNLRLKVLAVALCLATGAAADAATPAATSLARPFLSSTTSSVL